MRKMRKLLSAIIALLLVMGLSPAKPAKADTTETISITYTSTVNDGDAPVLPTISSGYEFVGGTFIEDTNKNDTFHDDKVMVMDQATLQAMAAQLSITPEDLISVAAAQGTTIRTTFRSGYNYAFTGQIKRSDNTVFSGADGDPFTGIIYVNGTDKTSRFEISDGLIAVPNDSGIIYECGSSATTKTLTGITITTAPTTTVYTEGQSFDSAGMVVTASYSDNSTAEVKAYTVSPSGALATTDTSVTISYTEGNITKAAMQAITVNSASSTTETIDITYTSKVNDGDAPVLPTISSGYEFVGGTFIEDTNKNDTFHDDKVMVMDQATLQAMADQLSITPEDLISVAAAQGTTIRTTFRSGYNYAFTGQIKRSDNTLFSGADGDPFTGIIYVNGTDKTSRFEISDGLIAVPNDSGIIYTCVSSGTTKTLKGITITTAPTTTVYTEGQSFDSAGMIVTATYSDNSSAEVKTYTVSPSGALATTDTSVTISYTEGGVTKTATQKITVNPGTNSFKITFDANGHGTAPAAQTVESGKTATKPSDPTASGWTFGGWYTEATCTNAFDFSKAITDDFTLYAKWTEGKAPEEIVYTVTVGGNSSVTQGNDMTITVKRSVADETCINHFTGIQIDGKPCAAGDYEAKAGSTIVTLKTATIQSLSAGTHTITVLFDDGKTETKLTVEEATPANNSGTDQSADTGNNSGKTGNEDIQSPKTGDKFTDGIYVLMILSAICMCGAVVIGKMRRNIGRR